MKILLFACFAQNSGLWNHIRNFSEFLSFFKIIKSTKRIYFIIQRRNISRIFTVDSTFFIHVFCKRLHVLHVLDVSLQDSDSGIQGRRKIVNWRGVDIHTFVFVDCQNNRFRMKFMMQKTNILTWAPRINDLPPPLLALRFGITNQRFSCCHWHKHKTNERYY